MSKKTTVSRINTIGMMSASRVSAYRRRDPLDAATSRIPLSVLSLVSLRRGAADTRPLGVQRLALTDEPHPEDVRRVERLVDAGHRESGGRHLVTLPHRNRRNVLCCQRLNLLKLGGPLGGVGLALFLRDEGVDRWIVVVVVVETALEVEGRQVVVSVRVVREPAQFEGCVLVLVVCLAVRVPLRTLQGHLEQTGCFKLALDLGVFVTRH